MSTATKLNRTIAKAIKPVSVNCRLPIHLPELITDCLSSGVPHNAEYSIQTQSLGIMVWENTIFITVGAELAKLV